ncbi:helix-turn-helix domain-containing protein [Martelella mediterranea]|uniref:helix-turn-helix domain-containing protein n=1 Tax=Martelella mediterranea TaxID=293089 RepID=UPI001E2FDD42|nr:helix-turn-helix domain-containing protein [Martelella mediterranea]MCD1633595.1 helix-turn-helix domain-containing protein [Martelella mediterranea]
MLVLPVPMVTALVLGFLILRVLTVEERPPVVIVFLSACAVQSLIVAALQYYGLSLLRPVQPVTATLIPVLAWLTFQTAFLRPLRPARDSLHLLVPAFAVFCILFAPATIDIILPAIFIAYGGLILYVLKSGGDALPLARLEAGRQPLWLWTGIAVSLLLSALSDGLIAVAFLSDNPGWAQLIISIFTSCALLSVGLLSVSPNAFGETETETLSRPTAAPVPDEGDHAIVDRLDGLLKEEKLYLEPSLTLARLARRLRLPAKQLSAALNRATGENISRHINRFRIDHACERLASGDSVTTAMLESGFNTKSNFNREFQRVTGKSPSAWVKTTRLSESL